MSSTPVRVAVGEMVKLWLADDVKAAWQLTEDAQYPSLKDNPLSTYVKAFVAAKMNNNDLAIQLFSSGDYRSNVFVPWFIWLPFMSFRVP